MRLNNRLSGTGKNCSLDWKIGTRNFHLRKMFVFLLTTAVLHTVSSLQPCLMRDYDPPLEGVQCSRSGKCIFEINQCDGTGNCGSGDYSDEENCAACKSDNAFHCGNQCIPKDWLCDGIFNCDDKTDESDAVCEVCPIHYPGYTPFKCAGSSMCINDLSYCNGRKDCPNGDDEVEGCIYRCLDKTAFLCDKTKCLNRHRVCNAFPDCKDGTDEQNCDDCGRVGFLCDNRQCIIKSEVCDGEEQCSDGSDELVKQCPPCGPLKSPCADGQCIKTRQFCDGTVDCKDGSDENNCTVCDGRAKLCDKRRCVAAERLCDNIADCNDGMDEGPDCKPCVAPRTFRCLNKKCISEDKVCDGKKNCQDSYSGSDEDFYMCKERKALGSAERVAVISTLILVALISAFTAM